MIDFQEIDVAKLKYVNADAESLKGRIVQTNDLSGKPCIGILTTQPSGFMEAGVVILTGSQVGQFHTFGDPKGPNRHCLDVTDLVKIVVASPACEQVRRPLAGSLLFAESDADRQFLTPVYMNGGIDLYAYIQLSGSKRGEMINAGMIMKVGALGVRPIE